MVNKKKKLIISCCILISLFFILIIIVPFKVINTQQEIYSFSKNISVSTYFYDYHCFRFNQCIKYQRIMEDEIQKTNISQLIKIYQSLNKDQPISFTINKEKRHVYVFTRPIFFKSKIEIYEYDGNDYYKKINEMNFYHPFYKTAFGDYDEDNKKVLLGIIGMNITEADFGYEDIIGTKFINIK